MLLAMTTLSVNAQNTEGYEIRDGKLGISVNCNDTLLAFGSNKLRTFINYTTKKIELSVNPSTLHSGIDSLDLPLEEGNFFDVVFRGELKIDHIATQSKAPQHFEIEGDLELNGQTKSMILQASFRDFRQAPNVECLLEIHFNLALADFGLDERFPTFGDVADVEILQTLMIPTERD